MNNKYTPKSESNPPQRQLPPEVAEVLRDQEEFYRQLETEGCPPAKVAGFRRATRLALRLTLAKSKRRDFLLSGIKHHIQKLKSERLHSSFPAGSPNILDEIESLVLQLPDVAEQQTLLRGVAEFRKTYSALDVVPFREPEQEVSP